MSACIPASVVVNPQRRGDSLEYYQEEIKEIIAWLRSQKAEPKVVGINASDDLVKLYN